MTFNRNYLIIVSKNSYNSRIKKTNLGTDLKFLKGLLFE